MNKFKTIKDRGREQRIAVIQAYGAHKAPASEKALRSLYNRKDPARLTRVLAVYGD
jgi:hypothetical protein